MPAKSKADVTRSEAEEIGGQLQAARDRLVNELTAFNDAMAEARRRHWNAASIRASMSDMNSTLHRLGREDLCMPVSGVKVEAAQLDLPVIVDMRQRKVARMLQLIANEQVERMDGAKWRAAFFPNAPAAQEQRKGRAGRRA